MLGLASIVEGQGEVQALPILLRRVLAEMSALNVFDVLRPIRQPRDKLLKPGELERVVELASDTLYGRRGAILVVLDSDDDLPCKLGPKLLQRAQCTASDIPARVVLARREWEAWYVAAVESLSGKRSLRPNLVAPNDPENRRDAKGWLADNRTTRKYSPVADQAAFAEMFDLTAARRAPSFSKFCRDVQALKDEVLKRFPEAFKH